MANDEIGGRPVTITNEDGKIKVVLLPVLLSFTSSVFAGFSLSDSCSFCNVLLMVKLWHTEI